MANYQINVLKLVIRTMNQLVSSVLFHHRHKPKMDIYHLFIYVDGLVFVIDI